MPPKRSSSSDEPWVRPGHETEKQDARHDRPKPTANFSALTESERVYAQLVKNAQRAINLAINFTSVDWAAVFPELINNNPEAPFDGPHTAIMIPRGLDRGKWLHIPATMSSEAVAYSIDKLSRIWVVEWEALMFPDIAERKKILNTPFTDPDLCHAPYQDIPLDSYTLLGPPGAAYPMTPSPAAPFQGPHTAVINIGQFFCGFWLHVPRYLSRVEMEIVMNKLSVLCNDPWDWGVRHQWKIDCVAAQNHEDAHAKLDVLNCIAETAIFLQKGIGIPFWAQTDPYRNWGESVNGKFIWGARDRREPVRPRTPPISYDPLSLRPGLTVTYESPSPSPGWAVPSEYSSTPPLARTSTYDSPSPPSSHSPTPQNSSRWRTPSWKTRPTRAASMPEWGNKWKLLDSEKIQSSEERIVHPRQRRKLKIIRVAVSNKDEDGKESLSVLSDSNNESLYKAPVETKQAWKGNSRLVLSPYLSGPRTFSPNMERSTHDESEASLPKPSQSIMDSTTNSEANNHDNIKDSISYNDKGYSLAPEGTQLPTSTHSEEDFFSDEYRKSSGDNKGDLILSKLEKMNAKLPDPSQNNALMTELRMIHDAVTDLVSLSRESEAEADRDRLNNRETQETMLARIDRIGTYCQHINHRITDVEVNLNAQFVRLDTDTSITLRSALAMLHRSSRRCEEVYHSLNHLEALVDVRIQELVDHYRNHYQNRRRAQGNDFQNADRPTAEALPQPDAGRRETQNQRATEVLQPAPAGRPRGMAPRCVHEEATEMYFNLYIFLFFVAVTLLLGTVIFSAIKLFLPHLYYNGYY